MKPYLASLLILLLLAGCGPSALAEDAGSASAETESSALSGDAEDLPDEFVVTPAAPAPEEAPPALVLYSETPIQVADDGPSFLIQAFYREGEEEYITDLRVIDAQTGELAYEAPLTEQTKTWESPKGVKHGYFDITIEDIDFDGYQDFIVYLGMNGNWNQWRNYIVWDNEACVFKPNPYGLSGLGLPSFDQEKQLVYSFQRYSATDHRWFDHQYIDGRLTTIAEMSEFAIWDFHLDDQAKEQIQALELLYDPEIHHFFHYMEKQLDRDTMEMVLVENIFRLSARDEYHVLKVYDFDSDLGKLLSEYLSYDGTQGPQ